MEEVQLATVTIEQIFAEKRPFPAVGVFRWGQRLSLNCGVHYCTGHLEIGNSESGFFRPEDEHEQKQDWFG